MRGSREGRNQRPVGRGRPWWAGVIGGGGRPASAGFGPVDEASALSQLRVEAAPFSSQLSRRICSECWARCCRKGERRNLYDVPAGIYGGAGATIATRFVETAATFWLIPRQPTAYTLFEGRSRSKTLPSHRITSNWGPSARMALIFSNVGIFFVICFWKSFARCATPRAFRGPAARFETRPGTTSKPGMIGADRTK